MGASMVCRNVRKRDERKCMIGRRGESSREEILELHHVGCVRRRCLWGPAQVVRVRTHLCGHDCEAIYSCMWRMALAVGQQLPCEGGHLSRSDSNVRATVRLRIDTECAR